MDSIIKKHTTEATFNLSSLGQKLDQAMIQHLNTALIVNKETPQALADILELPTLSAEAFTLLVRPWYRANMLADWCEKLCLPQRKENIKDAIRTIKKVKKVLQRLPDDALLLLLFVTSSEPELERLVSYLNELQALFEEFLKMDFKNGSAYSAKYCRRYGIESLFWMGKKMELRETGKPTQLNQYMHLVTDLLYADLNTSYLKFNAHDFIETFEKQKNILTQFIFNPFCPGTRLILANIAAKAQQP